MIKKVTFVTKRYDDRGQIVLPSLAHAKALLSSQEDIDSTLETIESLQGSHTADLFKIIVDWTPQGGMHMSMQVRWLDIARRLNKIDRSKTGQKFTLSAEEADLVWQRIKGKGFKPLFTLAFTELVDEFMTKAEVSWNEDNDEVGKGPDGLKG